MTDSTQKREFDAPTLQTPADGALAALQQAGGDAIALVEAWVRASNAAAVAEIAHSAAGTARKAAKRGLNVLKSRKVAVPERRTVAKLIERDAETLHAWLMPPDTNGTLLLTVAARSASRSHRTAFVFVHDALGIQRIESGVLSQAQLKDSLRKAAPSKGLKPVEVPIEWARWRIAEARRRHAERKVPEPLGFASTASLLQPIPDECPPHPFDEEGLVLDDEDAKEIANRSAELHALEEFRSWLPSRAAVDDLLRELGKDLAPNEEPPPDLMKERLEEQTKSATDRYFSPERRVALVRAMKDAGLSILARAGEQKALEVVAAIKVVENRGLITDPPHEVGFLRAFFDKAISVLAHQGGGSLRIPIPKGPAAQSEPVSAPASSANESPPDVAAIASGQSATEPVESTPPPTASIDSEWDGDGGST